MLTFLPNGDVKPCLAIPDEIGCIGHFRNGITIDRKKINMLQSRRIDVFEKCKINLHISVFLSLFINHIVEFCYF